MMLMVYITQFYHIDIAAVWVHINDADVGRRHGGPISGQHVTDIVNLKPDIGINIGYNIGCPDIGDMISRYRCQYRVPVSGVPISGYDSHRYRSQYRTRYRVLFLVQMQGPCGELQGAKNMVKWKKQDINVSSVSSWQTWSLWSEILTPHWDSNPEPLPSNRHALPLSHQAKWVAMPGCDFDGLYIIELPQGHSSSMGACQHKCTAPLYSSHHWR